MVTSVAIAGEIVIGKMSSEPLLVVSLERPTSCTSNKLLLFCSALRSLGRVGFVSSLIVMFAGRRTLRSCTIPDSLKLSELPPQTDVRTNILSRTPPSPIEVRSS